MVSIDVPARQVTVKELGTGKTIVVKLTADSQIKQVPAGGPSGAVAGGAPAGAPGGARGAGATPNLAQMIDGMPAGKIEDIKAGTSVIVSGAKGSHDDQVTAIVLVSNAEAIIRLAAGPAGRGGVLTFGTGGAGGLDMMNIP